MSTFGLLTLDGSEEDTESEKYIYSYLAYKHWGYKNNYERYSWRNFGQSWIRQTPNL
jgi:hypothetical protein